ncbi:MAG: ABC transporter substrate-binding protein [Myxococcota bacterium]
MRLFIASALFAAGAVVSPKPAAAAPPAKQVQKPLKTLIAAIRYGKYDLAAKQLDVREMVERIMADDWAKLSDDQKKELVSGFDRILRSTSFKRGKELFKHLDAVLYDKPRDGENGGALCKSTIVIHRNYKKTEFVIDWVLKKDGGVFKVYDIIMLGESTLEGIREDQIDPLIEEGGTAAVLAAMRDKVKEVESK